MKRVVILTALFLVGGCSAPEIPDDIPPPPPARKGDRITAPSSASESETDDGFGGGGFGGETPTVSTETPDADETNSELAPDANADDVDEESDEIETPTTGESGATDESAKTTESGETTDEDEEPAAQDGQDEPDPGSE